MGHDRLLRLVRLGRCIFTLLRAQCCHLSEEHVASCLLSVMTVEHGERIVNVKGKKEREKIAWEEEKENREKRME